MLNLKPGLSKKELLQKIEGHILEEKEKEITIIMPPVIVLTQWDEVPPEDSLLPSEDD